jgi:TRAP-type mannitol/chloroaromatic compound transport system permease small subunit
MPSISFELPHWVYWSTLLLFPAVAMILSRRGKTTNYSLPIAYMILLTGGILGLHRFYLRSLLGLVYLPLFLGILYANAEGRGAREVQSDTANQLRIAERVIEREAPRLEGADERLAELQAALDAAPAEGFARIRAERALTREQERVASGRASLTEAQTQLETVRPRVEEATAERAFWSNAALTLLLTLLALMAIDAVLIPGLRRRAQERADAERHVDGDVVTLDELEAQEVKQDHDHIGTGWTGMIDRVSYYTGEFVSYWAVIAVFVYYYEVVARYVFNSPTNWAHEGMYLMLGMQYLIAGAYAMMTDAHVKVDIFYANWSPMRKALVDLFTTIFFFIFAGTLLATGWIFASDATRVNEISFSEWGIAYWPFKWALVIGAALLTAQGVAKLARDIMTVRDAVKGV